MMTLITVACVAAWVASAVLDVLSEMSEAELRRAARRKRQREDYLRSIGCK